MNTSAEVFEKLHELFQASEASDENAVFQFDISGDGGGQWSVIVDQGRCEVVRGPHSSPTVTFTMATEDHVALANGALNPQMAFVMGKIKVSGDLSAAMRFGQLFRT